MATSGEIGSVYSPPKQGQLSVAGRTVPQVETVVDIEYNPTVSIPCHFSGYRKLILFLKGWLYKCEKGGIRRVLMNIFGNSLKFTTVRIGVCYEQR